VKNPLKGEIEVTTEDGQEKFILSVRLNEFCLLEKVLGVKGKVGVLKAIAGDKEEGLLPLQSETAWRSIIRVAFSRHHADLVQNDEAAGDLMDRFAEVDLIESFWCVVHGFTREEYHTRLTEIREQIEKEKQSEQVQGPEESPKAPETT
jgi:hypothetical protein